MYNKEAVMTAIDKGTHDEWVRGLREQCADDATCRLIMCPPDVHGLTAWITYLVVLETLLTTEYQGCAGMVTADGRILVTGGKDGR